MTDLTDILNWRRLNSDITLSGQPERAHFAAIRDLGVSHVINLARPDQASALKTEPDIVAAAGMSYLNIPVAFDAPSEEDYDRFCDALEALKGRRIHVHCIYNARVTAFFYRYAKEGRGAGFGLSEQAAFTLMDSVWRPGGAWARFLGDQAAIDQPHRYAGKDY